MANKDSGIVDFVRAYTSRISEALEKLTELEREGKHYQQQLPERLSEIESLEASIKAKDKEIEQLQARRDELRNEFMEANFSGEVETERAIKAERKSVDDELDTHKRERDGLSANLARLRGGIQDAREVAFTSLDTGTLPDIDAFLEEFSKRLREQHKNLEQRMAEAEQLYLFPNESRERNVERLRQERQERQERRRVLSRLLSHESVAEPRRGQRPRRGSAGWKAEADARNIELPRDNNMPVTEAEFELYRLVEAEYVELRRADGQPVEQPQQPQPEPKMTRSSFVSVGQG